MRWVLALLVLLAAPVWAQTYPDYARTTITDKADLLNDMEEAALDMRLQTLRREIGVELAVLTLPSQASYAPDESVEAFATGLFNHWGIGDATRNDGILVLILSEDRAMRIELGAGYGRDWDRAAADVINRSFLPAFAVEDYATGIRDGVEDVITSIAEPFAAGSDAPASAFDPEIWIIFTSVLGAIALMARQQIGDWMTRFRRCPKCGSRTLSRKRRVLTRATRGTEGHGEVTTHCANCTYRDQHSFRIPRRSASSSGSFGGGRSGGGGATGRW